ncbi:MAG TPA: NUDIX domain-containing protein [Candidatus Saccharimonadia bacterium]|nr:NUDIX domain-containing protein [Candidatus Saccharimonadia bacterium]
MELFDLVDRHDRVIGTTDKATARRTNQLHRAVAVYVFDRAGRLYVQSHKQSGQYDHSVGGHVKQGEAYDQAAYREAAEELGFNQPLTQLAIFHSDEGDRQHLFALYTCVADPSWRFVPNDEVEEITPMTLAEIKALMQTQPQNFATGFINTLAEYERSTSRTLT